MEIKELTPLRNQVVVLPIKNEKVRESGIITLDDKKRPQKGEVVSVGPEAKLVKVGEKILFGRYSTTDVEVNDIKYYIIKDEEILAIIN